MEAMPSLRPTWTFTATRSGSNVSIKARPSGTFVAWPIDFEVGFTSHGGPDHLSELLLIIDHDYSQHVGTPPVPRVWEDGIPRSSHPHTNAPLRPCGVAQRYYRDMLGRRWPTRAREPDRLDVWKWPSRRITSSVAAAILTVRAPQLCGRVADKSGPYRVSPEGSPLRRKQRATGLAHRRLSTFTGSSCAQPAAPYGGHGAIRADMRRSECSTIVLLRQQGSRALSASLGDAFGHP